MLQAENTQQGNHHFVTSDVSLATWLLASGIELLEIQPLARFKSTFVFTKPSQDLLDSWLSGAASANVRTIIASYRHLLRDSREVWQRKQEQGASQ